MIKREMFEKLLRCTQSQLKEAARKFLEEKGMKPVIGDGFVYAKGNIPILLVAHLDTVHKQLPTDIFYDAEKDVMWSPQGIGGDDRCGVYAIMKILENYKPYVLFTEDEETGCQGAKKVIDIIMQPDVRFIIEIDRRHSNDCVFYDCGNKEFQEYIQTFGFKEAKGSYSDICVLSDEWELASVNLSSGYYNEHTTSEIIKLKELEETYNRVVKILEDDKNNKKSYFYEKKIYVPPTPKKDYKSDYDKNKETKYEEGDYYDQWGYIDKYGVFHWWSDENKKPSIWDDNKLD